MFIRIEPTGYNYLDGCIRFTGEILGRASVIAVILAHSRFRNDERLILNTNWTGVTYYMSRGISPINFRRRNPQGCQTAYLEFLILADNRLSGKSRFEGVQ